MKLALIDLGSNSARMYLMTLGADAKLSLIAKRRVMTRLSEGMEKDGCLQPFPMARTCGVLQTFAEEINRTGAYTLAVATAAVRKAKNREEFLRKVETEAGMHLTVISGELEAFFDFQGVMAGLPELNDCLICDTGGGSTEFILVKDRAMKEKISLPFGAMTLTDTYGQNLNQAEEPLLRKFTEVPFLREAEGLPLVGIGGSVCALCNIDQHLQKVVKPKDAHGYTISPRRVRELYEILYSLSPMARTQKGVEQGRADTVCAGFLPSLLVMEQLHTPNLILCTSGLREGIWAELEKENIEFYLTHPELFLEKYV
ncbi:MAG: hypothetical protein U0L92_02180 [Clostridia bacterium]|nr:hypothetical protein [Clostridia bacterium]